MNLRRSPRGKSPSPDPNPGLRPGTGTSSRMPRSLRLPGYKLKVERVAKMLIPIFKDEHGATPFRSAKEVSEDHRFVSRLAAITRKTKSKPFAEDDDE